MTEDNTNRNVSSNGKTRIVFCGEKDAAARCLDFLYEDEGTEICGIVAAPQDWQSDLIGWGAKRRLKVFVGNINDYADELTRLEPDFIFSVQYRPLLKTSILKLPKRGCVNLHFGLLPRYGGCHPIAWALLNGEQAAGASLHYMSEKFDEGDVIAQTSVPITSETTARELFDSLGEAAIELLKQTYPLLKTGAVVSQPQDLSKKLYHSKDSINFARDRIIDWSKNGEVIQRQICAFSFEPFQLPLATLRLPDGRQLQTEISRTRLRNENDAHSITDAHVVGSVLELTDSGSMVVKTGDGALIEVDLLDKQPAKDFINKLGCSPTEMLFL